MSTGNSSHLIVHRVICKGKHSAGHTKHPESKDFHDVPRLRAKATQASALHGQQPCGDVRWYLEDHSDCSFAVINIYDCVRYHEKIADKFERNWMPPDLEKDVARQLRPHFSILLEDSDDATRVDQKIMLSTELEAAGRRLHSLWPTELSGWDQGGDLPYPYLQFWHFKDLIAEKARTELTVTQHGCVKALLIWLATNMTDEYGEAEMLFSQGLVSKRHWGKLFRVNDLVITVTAAGPIAHLCTKVQPPRLETLVIDSKSWEFDGSFYQQTSTKVIHWPSKAETIPITELSMYPLRFDTSEMADALERRGRIFWSCRKVRFVSYEARPTNANHRYMVDVDTYNLLHPTNQGSRRPEELDRDVLLDDNGPPISEYPSFFFLLPLKIRAFGFHDKKWIELLVEHIKHIKWEKEVFSHKLVLNEEKKELIEALVTVHLKEKGNSTRADFITGKGEGLLILLHGGPGTGKTLTAESVAELAERPLYRVTCGDIGTDPVKVEAYLKSVLHIGTSWNCVVLLDEADVFLEERTRLDLERNALVSVFLRVLEFHDGILILTSNRIGTFDEAFKSRIQLSLHYPPLTELNRLEIWENFITLLKRGQEHVDFEGIERNLRKLARHKLNGRQIRNTLNTARQLAQFKNERLKYIHLSKAIKNVVDFESYVTKLHDGQTEEEYAEAAGIRYSNCRLEDDSE